MAWYRLFKQALRLVQIREIGQLAIDDWFGVIGRGVLQVCEESGIVQVARVSLE